MHYLLLLSPWLSGIGTLAFWSLMVGYTVNIAFLVIHTAAIISLPACNVLIFKETRKHIVAISNSMVYNSNGATSGKQEENVKATSIPSRQQKKEFIHKKELQAVYVCILMVATYVIFWLPFIVITVTQGYVKNRSLVLYIVCLAMLNGIADPVIYIGLNRELRSMILKAKANERR